MLTRVLAAAAILAMPLAVAQVFDDRGSPSALSALSHEADGAQNRGDYLKSEASRRRAILMMIAVGTHPIELARQLSNLAATLNINGKAIESGRSSREAVVLLAYYPTEDQEQLAVLLGNLAEALRLQGKLDEAQAKFEEELRILADISASDSHFAASAKLGLGAIAAEHGDFEKAIALYDQAMPIFLRISDESHPVTRRYILEYEELVMRANAQ